MNPEISRRCSSCGISIRQRDALFCPECGAPVPTVPKASEKSELSSPNTQSNEAFEPVLPDEPVDTAQVEEPVLPDEAVNTAQPDEPVNTAQVEEPVPAAEVHELADAKNNSPAESATEEVLQSSETIQRRNEPQPPGPVTDREPAQTQGSRPRAKQTIAPRVHPGMAERTRETLHRASTVAHRVIEDEVKRVEKIRHVSSVVIEEASYDPSLRFVLVAVGLFIVFIILLVLSKVMG